MKLSPRLREQVNMTVLGLAFTVLFSSYNTLTNLMKPFLASVRKDDPQFKADGFIANCIIYAAYAVFLSLAPAVAIRMKATRIILLGAMGYGFNVAAYYTTSTVVIYLCSAVNGCTGAFLWAGQGKYIMLNSQPSTITSNTSIFWVFYKCSLLCGNPFVYVMLNHNSSIDRETRTTIVTALLTLNVVTVVILYFLKPPVYEDEDQGTKTTLLNDLGSAWGIFMTPNIIILLGMFFYAGMQAAFNAGVYSAAVGFTKQLGSDSAKLVPLVGIFIGIGEIMSGGILIVYGGKISQYKWGGPIVVLVGVLAQLTAYTLIFLYVPDRSVFGETYDTSYWRSNVYVVLGSALIIGTGDGCIMSQIYSILKYMFGQDSGRVVPLFSSFYTLAGAVTFLGSTLVGLHTQLIVLSVAGAIGTTVFTVVTYRVNRAKSSS